MPTRWIVFVAIIALWIIGNCVLSRRDSKTDMGRIGDVLNFALWFTAGAVALLVLLVCNLCMGG